MEQKTLEIAIPEGKTPEMTETASGCTIKWVNKEKTFEDYAVEYRCGTPYAIVLRKEPMSWPFENRMGLLKYIAGCLNECDVQTPACDVKRYRLYVNAPGVLTYCTEGNGSKEPAVYFTAEAAEKAIKIIPVEFILSF